MYMPNTFFINTVYWWGNRNRTGGKDQFVITKYLIIFGGDRFLASVNHYRLIHYYINIIFFQCGVAQLVFVRIFEARKHVRNPAGDYSLINTFQHGNFLSWVILAGCYSTYYPCRSCAYNQDIYVFFHKINLH